ncbi:hypothetical protein BDB00DRAFT_803855 [Zychaea mexicana]|uniref:uncharacterized protein n=1 Tax=Zychaea mexicana TaxID=64656 RepID=UPI0022FEEE95|nr:uncharacterized protein BDB00DRAFT_803855 [Zychaea mexicana]KAI9497745.1 hypothetical protein BDB00DRAFT_803855 [Zychaea mexicana]
MTVSNNIRNHPYTFEHALQHSADYTPPQVTRHQRTGYFTWLVFMEVKWVPFDANNQYKLEHTLNLGGTFVDIQDSHFPGVKRVRAFPKSNYISYLGVKYRLSRVMQPDAWIEPPDHDEPSAATAAAAAAGSSSSSSSSSSLSSSSSSYTPNSMNRLLPAPFTTMSKDGNSNNHTGDGSSMTMMITDTNSYPNNNNNNTANTTNSTSNARRLSHPYHPLARPVPSRVS